MAGYRAKNGLCREFAVNFHDPERARTLAEVNAWNTLQAELENAAELDAKIALVEKFIASGLAGKRTAEAERELKTLLSRLDLILEKKALDAAIEGARSAGSASAKVALLEDFLKTWPSASGTGKVREMIASIKEEAIPAARGGVDIGDEEGVFRNSRDGASMVYVPGGTLSLGISEEAGAARMSCFYIYRCEVTNAQFAKFLAAFGRDTDEKGKPLVLDSSKAMDGRFPWGIFRNRNGWAPVRGMENHPAVFVTWYGAMEYARWAGGALPSEAQWEYAACAGKSRDWPWENGQPDADHARFKDSSPLPVGSIQAGASPFGALDMAGNVWEWCLDSFAEERNIDNGACDPVCDADSPARVLKGGGFNSDPDGTNVRMRSGLSPLTEMPWLGFRVIIE